MIRISDIRTPEDVVRYLNMIYSCETMYNPEGKFEYRTYGYRHRAEVQDWKGRRCHISYKVPGETEKDIVNLNLEYTPDDEYSEQEITTMLINKLFFNIAALI